MRTNIAVYVNVNRISINVLMQPWSRMIHIQKTWNFLKHMGAFQKRKSWPTFGRVYRNDKEFQGSFGLFVQQLYLHVVQLHYFYGNFMVIPFLKTNSYNGGQMDFVFFPVCSMNEDNWALYKVGCLHFFPMGDHDQKWSSIYTFVNILISLLYMRNMNWFLVCFKRYFCCIHVLVCWWIQGVNSACSYFLLGTLINPVVITVSY